MNEDEIREKVVDIIKRLDSLVEEAYWAELPATSQTLKRVIASVKHEAEHMIDVRARRAHLAKLRATIDKLL